MSATLRISDAQMAALESAGLWEAPEGAEVELRAAITGTRLLVADQAAQRRLAAVLNDLSNGADEVARTIGDDERAAWARTDARVLSRLYEKVLDSRPD